MARTKHEDRVLKDLLQGKTPEKKIQVGGYDKEFSEKLKKEKEEQRKSNKAISDIMSKIRMPMFCPDCKNMMNKRLDKKFWMRMGKCFDCVIEEENTMRAKGTYREYERKKVKDNAMSWLKEQEQTFEDWKQSLLNPKSEFVNQDGTKEKWSVNKEENEKMVKQMETEFAEMKKELLKEINDK